MSRSSNFSENDFDEYFDNGDLTCVETAQRGFLSSCMGDEKIKSVRPMHGGLEYVIQTVNIRYSITAADFRRIGEDVLFAGNVLSEDVLEDLSFSSQKLSCIQKALNHLSYSAMSEKKLFMKLYGKFPKEVIFSAMELLKENGYIDDFRLAMDYCEDMFLNFRTGPLKIKAKLYQKQFSRETINEVFENFEFDDEQCAENMSKLISAKFGEKAESIDNAKKIEYLVRCGYSFDAARDYVTRNEEW